MAISAYYGYMISGVNKQLEVLHIYYSSLVCWSEQVHFFGCFCVRVLRLWSVSLLFQLPEQVEEFSKIWGNARALDIYYTWNFPHVTEIENYV